MSWMRRIFEKAKGRLTALLLASGLAACTASPELSPGDLDPRFAWPCDRLVMAWSVDAAALQRLIGSNLSQRSNDGISELRLSIMRCDRPRTSRTTSPPLLFAYLSIPLTADSVPVVITSVPADGWWALPHIIADRDTSAVFDRMGYEAITADISFEVDRTGTENTTIRSQLNFLNGQIRAAATVTGNSVSHETTIALVDNGINSWSAFFGQEQGQRYSSVSVILDVEGETPLSTFDLSKNPATVLFDEAIVSNRVLWRLPIAIE